MGGSLGPKEDSAFSLRKSALPLPAVCQGVSHTNAVITPMFTGMQCVHFYVTRALKLTEKKLGGARGICAQPLHLVIRSPMRQFKGTKHTEAKKNML